MAKPYIVVSRNLLIVFPRGVGGPPAQKNGERLLRPLTGLTRTDPNS